MSICIYYFINIYSMYIAFHIYIYTYIISNARISIAWSSWILRTKPKKKKTNKIKIESTEFPAFCFTTCLFKLGIWNFDTYTHPPAHTYTRFARTFRSLTNDSKGDKRLRLEKKEIELSFEYNREIFSGSLWAEFFILLFFYSTSKRRILISLIRALASSPLCLCGFME